MVPIGELLFWNQRGAELDDALRHSADKLRAWVDQLSEKLFDEKTDDEIASDLAVSEAIHPLELDLDSATPEVRETEIEVNDDYGFRGGGRLRVAGLEATKSIAFTGDPELWKLRPNPFDLNPPRGIIRGNRLIVGIGVREQQGDEAKRYIDSAIATVVTNLNRQRAQIQAHNNSIARVALPWIQQRRSRRGKASDLLNKLK